MRLIGLVVVAKTMTAVINLQSARQTAWHKFKILVFTKICGLKKHVHHDQSEP